LVYRRSPLNSPIVKTLFQGNLPLVLMAHSWTGNLYKQLNLATIPGYPNTMLKEPHKWLPKFTRNNVITPEDHLEAIGVAMEENGIEHEYVAMKLLVMSLEEDVRKWYTGLSITTWHPMKILLSCLRKDGKKRRIAECY